MALAMLLMMSGSINIYADEMSAETSLATREKAASVASLDTMALKNVDTTLKTEADGKFILTIRAKDGYYFTDSPFARSDNSNAATRRRSDSTTMVYNHDVSIYGDVTDSYMISMKGEAVILTPSKLILNIDDLRNATATLEKNGGVTPLDNIILTLDIDEKTAFEPVPYAIIDGEKYVMRSFVDEKTMYILSIMNVHKDTTIEVRDTATSTRARGTLDRIKVTGYINEEIVSCSTITLMNAAFHKLAKGSDILSWLYPLSRGTRVTAAGGVAKGDTKMQIKLCGKLTELSNAPIGIMAEDQYITNSNSGILRADPAGDTRSIQVRMKTPVITEENQIYIMGSNKPLGLICFGKLRDLYGTSISGSILSSDYYTLTSGSTVLTLKPEYLSTLEKGSYTVRFTYYDGNYAETEFTVGDKEREASKQMSQEGAPSTADAVSMGLLLVTLLTSGAGMAVVSVKRKRA